MPDLLGSDDTTATIKLGLDLGRPAVLRDVAPRAAQRWAQLNTPEADNTLIPHYTKVHAKPASCLRVLSVHRADNAARFDAGLPHVDRWTVQGGYIGVDWDDVWVNYILDLTDYAEWDDLAVEAMAWYLAWTSAWPLTENRAKAEAMWQGYVQAKALASGITAQEGTLDSWESGGRLVRSREGYGAGYNR